MSDKPAAVQPVEEEVVGVTNEQKVEQADMYELTVTEESLLRLHDLSISLPLPCDLCPIGTVFDSLEEFDAHMIDHPEAKMFACQLCSNTYRSWSNLVAHRKKFHSGEVLSCEKCGTKKIHERLDGSVAFPVDGKPHGCEECMIGLNTISDVYAHFLSHRAPPGGIVRQGGNLAKKTNSLREPSLTSNRQVVKVKRDGPVIVNGELISASKKDNKVFIPGMRKGAISAIIIKKTNSLGGNLIVCQGGKLAASASGVLNALKSSGIINQNMVGKLVAVPSGTLMKHLPGIKDGNILLKTSIEKGTDLFKNGIGDQSVEKSEKSSEGGVVVINAKPVDSLSEETSLNQSGPSDVTIHGDVTGIRISTEDVTAIENQSTQTDSVKSEVEDSSSIIDPGNESKHQILDLPVIHAVRLDELLVTGPKGNYEKSGHTSRGKQSGVLRQIAPKGGSANIPDGLKDLSPSPKCGPDEYEYLPKGHRHLCPHCSFTCVRADEYRNHLLRNSEVHNCVMCSSNHLKGLSVTDHEYCQAKAAAFCCIPCVAPMKSEEEFTQHLNEVHVQGYLPCCLCGIRFNWLKYLSHVKSCQQKLTQFEIRKQQFCPKCELCHKIFQSNGALKRHKRSHEPNRNILYNCDTCGRLFQHKGAYSVHLLANPTHGPAEHRARTPGSNPNFICEKCGKTFSKQDGLKWHLMRHAGLRPHACPSCPKSFVTRTSLVIHQRQHTGERPFMCEICGKGFTCQTSLYVHRRKHWTQGLEVGLLRKSKSVNPNLAARKPGVTSNPKKYTCPVCGKALSTKQIYEGHIRLHTGERPFVCNVCGRGFVTSKIMKLHEKRHESGRTSEKVESVRWVHDVSNVDDKGTSDIELGINGNSDNSCIFICPRCGVGLVSPDELGEHLAKGDCSSVGADMFVLPMTNESECIDTGSMVVVGQHE